MRRGWGFLALFTLVAVLTGVWTGFVDEPVLVDFPAGAPAEPPVAVVLVSGDAGLHVGMGRQVATRFARAGIPVMGIDSLAYFHRARDRGEVEDIVERAARRALAAAPGARLVFVGQSFGGDVLPPALERLPRDLRVRVAMVALVVPSRTAYYRVSPGEYFGFGRPDGDAVAAARRLDWLPVTCIFGREEAESLCPLLAMPNVRRVELPGGHPLERDADRVFAELRAAIACAVRT